MGFFSGFCLWSSAVCSSELLIVFENGLEIAVKVVHRGSWSTCRWVSEAQSQKLCKESHIHNFRHWFIAVVPAPGLSLLASASPLLHSALFHPICFSPPPLALILIHFSLYTLLFSLIVLCLFLLPPTLLTDISDGISLDLDSFPLSHSLSHSLFPSLSFSLFFSCCLYLYLPPSLPPSLSSLHTYTLQKHPSSSSWKGGFSPFFLLYVFHSSFPTLLLHLDAVLKLERICFIFSWSSWQGPFCWRTTLSTRTPSQCTSKASSALTNLTPSHTQDRRTTARHRRYSSTRWSPPSPQWRWVYAQLVEKWGAARGTNKPQGGMLTHLVALHTHTVGHPHLHVEFVDRTSGGLCRRASSWSQCFHSFECVLCHIHGNGHYICPLLNSYRNRSRVLGFWPYFKTAHFKMILF